MSTEPTRLPVHADRVVMGNSYSPPPAEWVTHHRTCVVCEARFEVTASEQAFWFERLRIPYVVSIDRCVTCRRLVRAHRRIMATLSAVLPRADAGTARDDECREAALAIVEGALRRRAQRFVQEPRFTSRPILERGATLIADLRRRAKRHDDLIPLQIRLQSLLGNHVRVERLRRELVQAAAHGATARAQRQVESWLASFDDGLRRRVIEYRLR